MSKPHIHIYENTQQLYQKGPQGRKTMGTPDLVVADHHLVQSQQMQTPDLKQSVIFKHNNEGPLNNSSDIYQAIQNDSTFNFIQNIDLTQTHKREKEENKYMYEELAQQLNIPLQNQV